MGKPFYIVANWKMHKTRREALDFVDTLTILEPSLEHVMIAAPATTLFDLSSHVEGSDLKIGAQDLSMHKAGPYTGELSARMLVDAGAFFSIVGHSERRLHHQETSEHIRDKLKRCAEEGILPILCVGETLNQKEQGLTQEVIQKQLLDALEQWDFSLDKSFYISYEPVWAIGTGHIATLEVIEQVHSFIKKILAERFSQPFSCQIPVLYGGSVTLSSIERLAESSYIDGVLVGGASLDPQIFANIIKTSRDIKR